MKNISHVFLLMLTFWNCNNIKENTLDLQKAPIYFHSVSADSSGIYFSNDLKDTNELNIIEYLYYYNGGGVAIGDINNDGLEDIYFCANQGMDRLYLNMGNLKFRDITKTAQLLEDDSWSTGVTMQDINNDGLLDIHVSKVGKFKNLQSHNLMYLNNGDNTFTEISKSCGLDFSGLSTQVAFFDFDKDGDMDMYLMNHSLHTPRSYGKSILRNETDNISGDRLFENKLNEGTLYFEDVTQKSGIYSSALGYGLALTVADLNNDGWLDIYVGNDFHENDYIYINQGPNKMDNKVTFKESAAELLHHSSRFTMGVDIADVNNDQMPDIITLDMMPYDAETFLKSGGEDSDQINQIKNDFGFGEQYARNTLQIKTAQGSFKDVALMTNTHASDWSWSPLIQDYDNDGQNDIFITNGIYKRPNDLDYINYLSNTDFAKYQEEKKEKVLKQLIAQMPTVKIPNVLFRNHGDLSFERLTETAGLQPSYSNGAAYSDLDNDGDLDIVINNINQTATLLENQSDPNTLGNFVVLELKGNVSDPNPHGSKVKMFSGSKSWVKEQTVVKGFQSSSTHRLHFGLGKAEKVDSILIHWPNGDIQLEENLSINQFHKIKKKEGLSNSGHKNPTREAPYNYFPFTHLENTYRDYEREILMPEKLSAEGPAIVKADFNGDGFPDLFIGGAKYQSPTFFIGTSNGEFHEDKNSSLRKDMIYEDVDAAALDIDNDGDMDLYVMSGGNEMAEGHENLEDRIYINDGKGNFERLPVPLIRTNGGSVSVADFDGDGHDDLFIGNRSMPGGYGLSPISYILKNDGTGRFSVQWQERLGMVTDSQWADINGDDKLDLIVVGDWMPVTVLVNQGDGSFLNQTKAFGLENTNGFWNTIEVTDLDNNGQLDILAGNTGENFKLKASVEHPIMLYIDDFDENGQVDPIIMYNFYGTYVPFASKDKLVEQMPTLKKKFLSYNTFSKIKNITDITGVREDAVLEVKKVHEIRSMVYMNIGKNTKAHALPKTAQMSTIQDFEIPGNGTIVYVGNYLDYTTELGQSSSNSGGTLLVPPDGTIAPGKSLNLPPSLNARRIISLNQENWLIFSNNDRTHIITKE